MIHYTHYEKKSDPYVVGEELAAFLHRHLEQYGDLMSFRLTYMGALGIFNSNYIEKRVVD